MMVQVSVPIMHGQVKSFVCVEIYLELTIYSSSNNEFGSASISNNSITSTTFYMCNTTEISIKLLCY